jgi:hypothetical protein
MPGFYERTADEDWEPFRPFRQLPNLAWNDPNLRFVDLDGDGHADVLVTELDALTWYPSLAEEGFGAARTVRQATDEERGPRLLLADGTQSIYLADMCGDGLSDLVRVRNGEVCYWPSLGHGRFGARVTLDNSPRLDHPDHFEQRRVRLADIDGSGTTDLIYLGSDGACLYFNQAGNRLSDPRRLPSFPLLDDVSSVVTADLLGNGTACQRWVPPRPAVLVAPQHHRLRIVEDHPQRDAARVLEAGKQRAHQRLDPLVGNDHHPRPARILEAIGREVDALRAPVQQPHVRHPEVELGELAGHALEAHHQLRGKLLLLEPEDAVERALAHRGTLLPQLAQELQRWGRGIRRDQLAQPVPDRVGHRGAADAATPTLLRVTGSLDLGLLRDPLHGTLRHPHLLRDLLRGHPCLHQGVHCMSVDHPDHPPSPPADGASALRWTAKLTGVSDPEPRQNLERICDRV